MTPPPPSRAAEEKTHYGPVPDEGATTEGGLLLVWLRKDVEIEHYGNPCIVNYYGYKLKTTVFPTRIELDWVEKWMRFSGPDGCASCDALRQQLAEARQALESLTPGGSEYVGDVQRCVAHVRERRESVHRCFVRVLREKREVEQQLAEAKERSESLRNALHLTRNLLVMFVGSGDLADAPSHVSVLKAADAALTLEAKGTEGAGTTEDGAHNAHQ